MLWFIDLTVATCHIQYTFLSLCRFFFHEKTDKTRKYYTKMAADVNTGAQSINTERASKELLWGSPNASHLLFNSCKQIDVYISTFE